MSEELLRSEKAGLAFAIEQGRSVSSGCDGAEAHVIVASGRRVTGKPGPTHCHRLSAMGPPSQTASSCMLCLRRTGILVCSCERGVRSTATTWRVLTVAGAACSWWWPAALTTGA